MTERLRTPPPSAVPEIVPRTPESKPTARGPVSAQDLIAKALNAAAVSAAAPHSHPRTPNNWRVNASTDLTLNVQKVPSPLTPFNPARYSHHTPFKTPPPRTRAKRQSADGFGSDGSAEKPTSIGKLLGSASGALFQTPHPLLSTSILGGGSAGPDYGLRDMFGFSPMKTPLGRRGTGEEGSSSLNGSTELALYKRSLLPPSPYRTPTSSRYGRPPVGKGEDGEDDNEYYPYHSRSEAFEIGKMQGLSPHTESKEQEDELCSNPPDSPSQSRGQPLYPISEDPVSPDADELLRLQDGGCISPGTAAILAASLIPLGSDPWL